MVGKKLIELALPKRFGILVAAIRRGAPDRIIQPSPHEPLQAEDNLMIVCNEAAISKFIKGV
jgi:trk system potassium uptake protein TrkA